MVNLSEKYIPILNKHIFWDVNILDLDNVKDKSFIIARIFEVGDIYDTKWLLKTFSKEDIVDTITASKIISKRTANFFRIILNITKPILCLTSSFQKTHRELWMQ